MLLHQPDLARMAFVLLPEAATAVAATAAALLLIAAIYKLFFAPIAPRGTNYETMPGMSRPFGKYFGRFPESNFLEWHLHFRAVGEQYGGMVRKRVMGRNVVVVTDLDVIRDITRDREHFLHRAPTGIREIIPLGLLGLDTNDMWAFHRRTMSPMFADRYMRVYGETFARLNQILMDQWDRAVASGQSEDVHLGLMKLSLDALGMCGFGTDFQAMTNPESSYLEGSNYMLQAALLQTAFVPTLFRLFFRTIARRSDAAKKIFEKAIDHVLEESRDHPDEHLHMLKEMTANPDIPDVEIKDELLTMVMAGHETTANAMSWLLFELAKNPAAQARVHAEVDALYALPDFDPTKIHDMRTQLPLLKSAIAESLRLYPTVPVVPRICNKATTIRGYYIPEGTRMWCSLYGAFRNAKLFERPDDFVVDRFVGVDLEGDNIKVFLPFGAGPRMCIGRRFAMLEMLVTIVLLLHRYSFTVDTTHPVHGISHITFAPKTGIKLFIALRHQ